MLSSLESPPLSPVERTRPAPATWEGVQTSGRPGRLWLAVRQGSRESCLSLPFRERAPSPSDVLCGGSVGLAGALSCPSTRLVSSVLQRRLREGWEGPSGSWRSVVGRAGGPEPLWGAVDAAVEQVKSGGQIAIRLCHPELCDLQPGPLSPALSRPQRQGRCGVR